jgi:hypothetical protein
VSDEPHVVNMDRYEWERLVRRCRLPATTKLVAAMMAHYANRDGSRIYPGVAASPPSPDCPSGRSARPSSTSATWT